MSGSRARTLAPNAAERYRRCGSRMAAGGPPPTSNCTPMRFIRRPAIAAAVVALAAVTVADAVAVERPDRASFSVGGGRSSFTDIRLTSPVSFNVTQNGTDDSLRVTGGKTYVGFTISDAQGRLVAGAVTPDGYTLDGLPLVVRLGPTQDPVRLPAGRYRVTYLGDAPGRVYLPVAGSPAASRTITGRTPVEVTAEWAELANDLPGPASPVSLPLSETTLKATAKAGSWTSLSTVNVTRGPQDDHAWLCMRPRGSRDCTVVDNDFGLMSTSLGSGETAAVVGATYAPGTLPPGAYDAGIGWRNLGVEARQAAFVITFRP